MTANTSNRGYPYPQATDVVRPYLHVQALAEAVDADVEDLAYPAIGRLVQVVAQTGIPNATMTAITFTTEELDTGTYHSTSVNTSRVTPTQSGIYDVRGAVSLTGQTDYTIIETAILVNGTAIAPAHRFVISSTASQTLVLPVQAFVQNNGAGEYFGVGVRATRSGAGTTSTVISNQFASVLEWKYERPLP